MKLTIIKYENANVLESTWLENEIPIHCQAYHETQMALLREHATHYGTDLSEADELLIAEVEENIVPYIEPTPTKEEYIVAIQAKLDTAAQAKGYDNIVSACSYAGYENPFRVEGEAFGVWRANVWTYGYAQLELIQTGARTVPTVEGFLAELPTMEA